VRFLQVAYIRVEAFQKQMTIIKFLTIGLVSLGAMCSQTLMADPANQWLDIPVAMVIPSSTCTPQAIAFEGTSHTVTHVTITKNSFLLQIHMNMQNVTGTGLLDGSKYNLIEGNDMEMRMTGAGPFDAQMNMEFSLIGQGQAPNSRLRVVLHVTVDANGNTTADFVKGSLVCQ
jgi:hypothetical protein